MTRVLVPVVLACPSCAYTWLSGYLSERAADAWWSGTVEDVAKRPFCPSCEHQPPMRVVERTAR